MYSYLSKLFLHKITPFGNVLRIFIETHNSETNNRLTPMYEKTTRIFLYICCRELMQVQLPDFFSAGTRCDCFLNFLHCFLLYLFVRFCRQLFAYGPLKGNLKVVGNQN
jgi:hypothetical protein